MNGLSFGALLFLLSSGFTLAFGMMNVVNIAHGSFYMLGSYIAFSAMSYTGIFPLAILAGALAVFIVGILTEELLLRHFHLRDLPQILLTMGISLIISRVCLIVWGGDPLILRAPSWLRGPIFFGDMAFPKYRIFLMGVAVIVGVVLWLLLEKSRIGSAVRATVDDEEMAGAMKVNTRLLSTGMFGFSALLAGLAGSLGAPYIGAHPGLDFQILPLALVVVIIGGLGSLSGAALGSVFVGLIDSLGKAAFPELSYFTIFVPMIIILAIRPRGIMGRE
ncbi:branched-chain amino acid ABC transporter permease [Pararhodobacter oceanensis]|uniref:branched-chain amino acid ABC transporter permease n=1 Tax=Pararhodobacter oceanensis TaxID=2172121 RepID=UPI003A91DE96